MPLVRFVGTSRGDNTQIISLAPGPQGEQRQLTRGGDAVEVSHDELKALAGIAGVEVIESTGEPTAATAATESAMEPIATISTAGAQTWSGSGSSGGFVPGAASDDEDVQDDEEQHT